MAKRSKLNPRQEKFVREYVKTGNGRQSYLKAGYASQVSLGNNSRPADANAARLIASDNVKAAIVAHQMRALSRHDYTVDKILNDLEDDRQFAKQCEQAGPAVQATTTKARLLGMIVDRKEVGQPGEFAALDSIAAVLALAAKELGHDSAALLAKLVGADPPTIDATPNNESLDEENN